MMFDSVDNNVEQRLNHAHVSPEFPLMPLTVKGIAAAKATAKRQEVPDGNGLYLIIQPLPSSARSWAFRYRSPTNPEKVRKHTLGSADDVTLAEARDAAAQARAMVRQGIDPADAQKAERARVRDRSNLVSDRLDDYLAAYRRSRKPSSHAEVARLFERWVRPAIGHRRIEDISRRDIQQILDTVSKSAPISGNRLLAALRPFFASVRIGGAPLPLLPTDGVDKPADERGRDRDRVLSDAEISWLWRATDDDTAFSAAVRLMLLTGQRRGEVAGMTLDEIDLEAAQPLWTLPASRTKNHRENVIPLAPAAIEAIKRPAKVGRSRLVLTSTTGTELSGWSKSKSALDARMLAVATNLTGRPPNIEPWVLHDLRRTAATGMAAIGIQPHVIEAVLNHKTGSIGKLAGIYNRYAYLREKGDALTLWALTACGQNLS